MSKKRHANGGSPKKPNGGKDRPNNHKRTSKRLDERQRRKNAKRAYLSSQQSESLER